MHDPSARCVRKQHLIPTWGGAAALFAGGCLASPDDHPSSEAIHQALAGTDLAGTKLAGPNRAATNLAGTTSGANIHGLAGTPDGMLYSGEDLWQPKESQCIVLGLGSTAFSRLLTEQSPGARMSVALGKLPWGFPSTAGGPVVLDAWEAVVWGDATYCSFVLAAPTGTTWPGVAGL